MVVILSDSTDISTCDVIDWLHYYKVPFIRINGEDEVEFINFFMNSTNITFFCMINSTPYLFSSCDINSFWFRRGGIKFKGNIATNEMHKKIRSHLTYEKDNLAIGIYSFFQDRIKLGSINTMDVNKIDMLINAKNSGLEIPLTLITTKKADLLNFYEEHQSLITKGIQEVFKTIDQNALYGCYTEKITSELLESLPECFTQSLFQKELVKKFEIRTFYLAGSCYSMAIFSQDDPQTKVDFRKYNTRKPNRVCPYKLPNELGSKINSFMNRSGLETGSLDFVYTSDNKYIFLEVNPVGQFGMVSGPCNYYLEKKIANHLINN